MGVHFPSAATTVFVANVPASGADTVIITTPPLNLILNFAQVLIWWYLLIAVGTDTTAVTVRLRRGALITSTVVNVPAVTPATAGTTISLAGSYIDTPGAVAGQQYSISLQGTATTGAMVNGDGCFTALVL